LNCSNCGDPVEPGMALCDNCGAAVPGAGWVCPACGEHCEEQFDTCWKCQARREGPSKPVPAAEPPPPSPPVPRCAQCGVDLEREGIGLLPRPREPFKTDLAVDVYSCPRCGRVELYRDGVGERFRGRS
jgi:predicted amidophosphoribosyltransferase